MNVSFACKIFPLDQVLRCTFGLSRAELVALKELLKTDESTVEELAARLKKDRTTVQRALASMTHAGLVRRRQYNLSGGGYQYAYSSLPKEEIKRRVEEHFVHFSAMIRKEIERW